MKVYFANGLFSQADAEFNAKIVAKIRAQYPLVEVYLPQENASINDKNNYANSLMIAKADTDEVLASDLLIAVLDGPTIDNGVASEIGVAYQAKVPIIGLYTDTRRLGADNQQKLDALQEVAENQFHYLNLYTTGLIKLNGKIVTSVDDLVAAIDEYAEQD
ncbi:nucleoside 2-deoxyribosyltransferase [Schleiferilactobacillus harbinensis]|uniref:nucleoside 2-deoxyribosyltransferase n=1 Tax=Schleiferilactobacillus harbinensis TaxID=304207 RepID=UPI000E9BDFDB|nr:nucleoside 2-deoxyribosyltransferase [Schleiferilactobacillus harbinensis]HAY52962.1 nucleoside 2-deoxyribosyltransferase [Lactobacillus sp.]MCI1686892.1 nucleoside 2-deoxyribosyltransferase [Schleiferilactobacillus harbinensis]MCI1784252.1 nucleoside 2-deoxyribosyltransferase [Schleiferilactobacillus harbinensis]MCI1850563.1 nucleoside 2-deoxyribosyltransferase [Schleiferilactobacillus harbinensis]QEU46002.1 nucleoside 2-deoxyribosyltransferase [Schleiferilactobacillus harbinensis]